MLATAGVVRVSLSRGLFAVVDEHCLPLIASRSWCAMPDPTRQGKFYAGASRSARLGPSTVLMHRVVVGAAAGQIVDHIDGDGLNNCLCNLRVCSSHQNQWNASKYRKPCSSQFKGVSLHRGRWVARLMVFGKRISVGSFDNELDAAIAWNEAAKVYHGEFARLNIIPAANPTPLPI